MKTVQEAFAEAQAYLEQCGYPRAEAPLAMTDQLRAGFVNDLATVGVSPSQDGMLYAALAGMAVGMKVMILHDVPQRFIYHYVQVCEYLLPLLDSSDTDLSSLGDADFLASLGDAFIQEPEPVHFACSRCGGSDAVVPVGNYHFCLTCASEMVAGGMNALRLAGQGMPQVGGQSFDREAEESAHTEGSVGPQAESTGDVEAPPIDGAETPAGGTVDTPPSQSWERQRLAARPWQDLTVNEALRRLFGRRK